MGAIVWWSGTVLLLQDNKLWSGLLKVLTWIWLRKKWLILRNFPMFLNYNISADISGPNLLHSAVTDSRPVNANASLLLLLLRAANQLLGLGSNHFFHTEPSSFGFHFPLIINLFINCILCLIVLFLLILYLHLFGNLKHWLYQWAPNGSWSRTVCHVNMIILCKTPAVIFIAILWFFRHII